MGSGHQDCYDHVYADMKSRFRQVLLPLYIASLILMDGGAAVAAPLMSTMVFTAGSHQMTVDGMKHDLDADTGVTAMIIPSWNRMVVPLRAYCEASGGSVSWNSATRMATARTQGHMIELQPDQAQAMVDGKTTWICQPDHRVAPLIVRGRLMVPVCFLADQAGGQVTWDAVTASATLRMVRRLFAGSDQLTAKPSEQGYSAQVTIVNPLPAQMSILVSLMKNELPDGWQADFCTRDCCYLENATFKVAANGRVTLDVHCFPKGTGTGRLVLTAAPEGHDSQSVTIDIDVP